MRKGLQPGVRNPVLGERLVHLAELEGVQAIRIVDGVLVGASRIAALALYVRHNKSSEEIITRCLLGADNVVDPDVEPSESCPP